MTGRKERKKPVMQQVVGNGMRLDKEDGELKSNPVSDGGVGGTFGPRTDRGVLKKNREMKSEIEGIVSAEGGANGGVASVDELLMVLRYIPMSVLGAYSRLIDAAVGERALGSGRGYDDLFEPGVGQKSGPRISSSSGQASIGKASKVKGQGQDFIKSEMALAYRSKVDRKLRKIAREMHSYLATPTDVTAASVQRRCAGSCKRLGDGEWLYCPWCAGPMEEVGEKGKKK